jgi:hypothetical protein
MIDEVSKLGGGGSGLVDRGGEERGMMVRVCRYCKHGHDFDGEILIVSIALYR